MSNLLDTFVDLYKTLREPPAEFLLELGTDGEVVLARLRLLFATPRRWLTEGQGITVTKAPTAFGPVSLRVDSRLEQAEVIADVELPQRNKPALPES